MVLMIGYDLNSPGQDYRELHDAIRSLGPWWHYFDSTWFVETETSPQEVRTYLQRYIDSNDELIVFRLHNHWSGIGFEQRAYDWLKARTF